MDRKELQRVKADIAERLQDHEMSERIAVSYEFRIPNK